MHTWGRLQSPYGGALGRAAAPGLLMMAGRMLSTGLLQRQASPRDAGSSPCRPGMPPTWLDPSGLGLDPGPVTGALPPLAVMPQSLPVGCAASGMPRPPPGGILPYILRNAGGPCAPPAVTIHATIMPCGAVSTCSLSNSRLGMIPFSASYPAEHCVVKFKMYKIGGCV